MGPAYSCDMKYVALGVRADDGNNSSIESEVPPRCVVVMIQYLGTTPKKHNTSANRSMQK